MLAFFAVLQAQPPTGGSGKGGGTGGGNTGGSTAGQLTCSSTTDYVGDPALAGTAAALLGSVACVDQAAVAYRRTLDASIAGSDTSTVNVYGPFENGFTSSVPGMSCLGSNTINGGIDTYTAELIVRNLCGDNTIRLLGTCGDHANPVHFHEYLTRCLTTPDASSGHSSRLGTAGDGLGVYGPLGNNGVPPQLDACGATFGVTPDSGGVAVPYYVAQNSPPFFIGCYTRNATTTLSECEALYAGCSATPVTITTEFGSGPYREWCPCWNSFGSNAGEANRPAFWPALQSPPPATPNTPPSPTSSPQASPPTPPSPKQPPTAPPPAAKIYSIKFTAIVAGDESSFDRDAYKQAVSGVAGVPTSRITLRITPGSISVETEISADTYSEATSASSSLDAISGNSTAATALLGVQVESMTAVTIETNASPPPSSPPSESTNVVLLVVVSVVVLFGIVLMGAVAYVMTNRKPPVSSKENVSEQSSKPLLSLSLA